MYTASDAMQGVLITKLHTPNRFKFAKISYTIVDIYTTLINSITVMVIYFINLHLLLKILVVDLFTMTKNLLKSYPQSFFKKSSREAFLLNTTYTKKRSRKRL